MINVNLSFGGDRQSVLVNTVADLRDNRIAAQLGYSAANVEFVRGGTVLRDSDRLYENETITVRTKANTKGAAVRVSFGGDSREVVAATVGDLRHDSIARDFGYAPANVTFAVNGTERPDTYSLYAGDTVTVRTKANTKG